MPVTITGVAMRVADLNSKTDKNTGNVMNSAGKKTFRHFDNRTIGTSVPTIHARNALFSSLSSSVPMSTGRLEIISNIC